MRCNSQHKITHSKHAQTVGRWPNGLGHHAKDQSARGYARTHGRDIRRKLNSPGTVERQLTINKDRERVEFMEHPPIPKTEQDARDGAAKIRDPNSHNLLCRDTRKAPGVTCRHTPVHRRNHPQALLLPEPANPPRPVDVPYLHRKRPANVHRKVRSQGAPEPAHVRDSTGRMRPAGLKVAVEQEEMTKTAGNLASRSRRPVLQQRGDNIRKGKSLREKVGDTNAADDWVPAPRVKSVLQHDQKSDGIGNPTMKLANTRSSQRPKSPSGEVKWLHSVSVKLRPPLK